MSAKEQTHAGRYPAEVPEEGLAEGHLPEECLSGTGVCPDQAWGQQYRPAAAGQPENLSNMCLQVKKKLAKHCQGKTASGSVYCNKKLRGKEECYVTNGKEDARKHWKRKDW